MRAGLGALLLLTACGGGGGAPPDAIPLDAAVPDAAPPDAIPPDAGPDATPGENPGFVTPTETTRAFVDGVDVGPADWSCLGTPGTDLPTTVAVALAGELTDLSGGQSVQGATIDGFVGLDPAVSFDSDGPTPPTGDYALTVPVATSRFGVAISAPDYADTLVMNLLLAPAEASQVHDFVAVSTGILNALPALIGVSRTPGTSVALARQLDCQGRVVGGAIATVSSLSGIAEHVPGADTYYFHAGAGLPVRHTELLVTSGDGRFMVIELPAAAEAWIQVWGIPSDSAPLTLLGELRAPNPADAVVSGDLEPLRAP